VDFLLANAPSTTEEYVSIIDQLAAIEQAALAALETITTSDAIGEWKSNYLGKQGAIAKLSRELGTLPSDQRPAAGQRFNAVRAVLDEAFTSRETTISAAACAPRDPTSPSARMATRSSAR
jgi:phenylalanyl-tRNA synthetase alpha chain